jgi:hypothetical protein
MEQPADPKLRLREPTPPGPSPRATHPERAMHDFKRQLGLDDRAWGSILMSVREPSWERHGEPDPK